jgi:hypothetical protein
MGISKRGYQRDQAERARRARELAAAKKQEQPPAPEARENPYDRMRRELDQLNNRKQR